MPHGLSGAARGGSRGPFTSSGIGLSCDTPFSSGTGFLTGTGPPARERSQPGLAVHGHEGRCPSGDSGFRRRRTEGTGHPRLPASEGGAGLGVGAVRTMTAVTAVHQERDGEKQGARYRGPGQQTLTGAARPGGGRRIRGRPAGGRVGRRRGDERRLLGFRHFRGRLGGSVRVRLATGFGGGFGSGFCSGFRAGFRGGFVGGGGLFRLPRARGLGADLGDRCQGGECGLAHALGRVRGSRLRFLRDRGTRGRAVGTTGLGGRHGVLPIIEVERDRKRFSLKAACQQASWRSQP